MALQEFTLEQIQHVRRLPDVTWVNEVNLPAIFTVKEAPGVFFFNAAKWLDPNTVGLKPGIVPSAQGITSAPSPSGKPIVNLFVIDGKLKVEYDDGNP